jgi:hypothetical protein
MGCSLRQIIPALAVTFCVAGCAEPETFMLQDPSRVDVLRDNQVVLPAGGGEEDARLSQAEVDPSPGGHSHVQVDVRRQPSGAISLRWDTKLPLTNGEEQDLLSPRAGGVPLALSTPLDLTRPVLRWSACAYLIKPTYRTSTYSAVVAMRACGPSDFAAERLTLETSWDNVKVRHMVGGGARRDLAGLGYVFAMAGVGLIPAQPIPVVFAISGGLLLVGGALAGASYLFPAGHDQTETLHAAAKAAEAERRHAKTHHASRHASTDA